MNIENKAFISLKETLDSYTPISDESWSAFKHICKFRRVDKHTILYQQGKQPNSFAYVYSGLFRLYISDSKGNEYNKNFFDEGTFPGSMAALLTSTPSQFIIDSLEPSDIILIDFAGYRQLLLDYDDLKLFQIYYLEKNWLLAKDAREVQIVQDDAISRYQRFLQHYPLLAKRLPQYHIASHLGITPTQLSRIRKKFKLST